MRKLVYLFELDSVRKTDKEIEIGQRALYEEIVGNGNIVVLTYNQLVDSRAFFSLLKDETYRSSLIKLFEEGWIRISQYGDNRTISKYLIDSLAYERSFIYSGWPLKSTQKRLLALIKRSLTYSDLTEITDYIEDRKTDIELLDLFIEVEQDSNRLIPTRLTKEQCKEILENLYHLLKTVLLLSLIHTIYVNPKTDTNMTLSDFLKKAFKLEMPSSDTLWNEAIEILKSIGTSSNDRSVYYHKILNAYKDSGAEDKRTYQYAEAIVDLCYNYQLEYSVCNSSKHYNVDELSSDGPEGMPTFGADFSMRLKQSWDIGDLDNRFLLEETNAFEEYGKKDPRSCKRIIRDITRASRLFKNKHSKESSSGEEDVHRYEYNITSQRRRQKSSIGISIGKNLISMIISILFVCAFELISNYIQDMVQINISFFAKTLLFLFITELITTGLSQMTSKWVLSLSEALAIMVTSITDLFVTCCHSVKTYCNIKGVNATEKHNKGARIDYIMTEPVRKYKKFVRAKGNGQFFVESDRSPKLATMSGDTIKEALRLEELYGCHYGVVYQSKYNTLIVDPTINETDSAKDKPYIPYERIVPSGNNGTVLVTMHDGKFVLLKQFRHAPRKEQFAFPRGYNENKLSPVNNAVNELYEELNAKPVGEPVWLGKISPDSGLTSSCADVYLVNIDNYSPSSDEGIVNSVELDEEGLVDMLTQDNKSSFDDGFTLAAYTLYRSHKMKATLSA